VDYVIKDMVKETSTTTGTGTLTLAGAVTGYQSFLAVGNGNACKFCIQAVDGSGVPTGDWEVSRGVYTSSGTTLTRASVLASSNSGAAVNFGAGTKSVFLVGPAADLTSFADVGSLTKVDHSPADLLSVYQASQNRNAATYASRMMGQYRRHQVDHRIVASAGAFTRPGEDTGVTSLYMVGNTEDFSTTSTPFWMPIYNPSSEWLLLPLGRLTYSLPTLTSGKSYDLFVYGKTAAITGATNATPIVVTSNSHGLTDGDFVYIDGVIGNYSANGIFKIANKTTNTFELQTVAGSNVAGNGTYSSGGAWWSVKFDTEVAWTNDTTRATDLALQDGVLVKSGDATRRYMGTFYTTSTTQTESSYAKRLVWNMYNRRPYHDFRRDNSDSWTDAGNGTWSAINGGNAAWKHEFVKGINSESSHAKVLVHSGPYYAIAVAYDSTSTWDSALSNASLQLSGTNIIPYQAEGRSLGSKGYHYLQGIETTGDGTTRTAYGDNGGTNPFVMSGCYTWGWC
jgi:hypothetical protein